MTKREMLEVLATMEDDDIVAFIRQDSDSEGYIYQYLSTSYAGICKLGAKPISVTKGRKIYVEV